MTSRIFLDRLKSLFVVAGTALLIAACAGFDDGAPADRVTDVKDTRSRDLDDHDGIGAATTRMDSLVTVEWLGEHLGDPNLVVLDCTVLVEADGEGVYRSVSGRQHYEEGHIPTAAFADLFTELSDRDSPHMFAVPAPAQFVAAMSRLGVGDETRVVLYDSLNSAFAARVWWMLRWIGFDNAALLDGGYGAWTAQDRPVTTDVPNRPAGKLTLNLRPDLIAGRDEVLAAIGDEQVTIIDALPASHYRGESTMYARPGHISGATNVSVMSLLDEHGHYKPRDKLEALFTSDRDDRNITYCGGGIAASANAFIMTRLGYKDLAVYTASLQEWAADPANPMEVATDLMGPEE